MIFFYPENIEADICRVITKFIIILFILRGLKLLSPFNIDNYIFFIVSVNDVAPARANKRFVKKLRKIFFCLPKFLTYTHCKSSRNWSSQLECIANLRVRVLVFIFTHLSPMSI